MKASSFINDLEFGKYFEQLSLSYLLPYEKIEFAPDTRFCDWDYKVKHTNGEEISYEIKVDRCVRKTGNFFIEIKNKFGEPSGLETTKADFYVLIKPCENKTSIDVYYEVPIEYMREFYKKATHFRHSFSGAYGFLLRETDIFCESLISER